MLNDFTWNMTGYIPKHQVNPHDDGIIPYVAERIFQLEPEPPAVGNLNEYILAALHEKDLIYFSFFIHYYEPQLNKRIKDFLGVDDGEWGEISLDFQNGKAGIIRLADWDTVKTNKFANRAIAYLLNCENEKLPKETTISIE